jgi:hypothetical protein
MKPTDQKAIFEEGESLRRTAHSLKRVSGTLKTSFWSLCDKKGGLILDRLAGLEDAFLKYDTQASIAYNQAPADPTSNIFHVAAVSSLDSQRTSIRDLISGIRIDVSAYQEEIKFNRALLASIVALGLSVFSIGETWWLYRSQIQQQDRQESELFQQTFNGVLFELAVAKDQCEGFIKTKEKHIKEMGSPAWILQANAIRDILKTGKVDDKQTYLALFYLADLFTSLNERNHLMASASVDLLPDAQRKHFLKDNLNRFGENCREITNTLIAAEPVIKRFSKVKGLVYESVDFDSLDFMPDTKTKKKEKP